ncbi:uncharacterized protein LOC114317529 [Camellia sinensis]|uniref:uncharacterized protein LOC114317529 n=1 Tax=Camellia sinensis TaxID=4442 RepID=UPI0010357E75|nr:uncharacterized protein LOC114317529 [Camellia sinensis]
MNCYLTQREFVGEVTQSDEDCHDLLRMNIECFQKLVYILRGIGRLKDTVHCSVEEQVAIFLHIVSHNVKNRPAKRYYKWSSETMSRYFHMVLDAIISMEDNYLKQPSVQMETPKEIHDNPRMWPYFKDCVGAIDGAHLHIKVSTELVARFHGRKQWPLQNVLAACTFDLRFTNVLAGWEGSASDSRILGCAINREHGITCPLGFPLLKHYITPFRSTRYYLNEIREPMFSYTTQRKLVIAACLMHNHIRGVMPYDPLLNIVDGEINNETAPIHDIVDEMEAHESQQPIGDGKKRGNNIVWSKEMDKCLILELMHQANEGYKVDKGFKDQAYIVACSSLNSSFNLSLSREHCVNRLKTIKKKFRLVQEMLSKSGFS